MSHDCVGDAARVGGACTLDQIKAVSGTRSAAASGGDGMLCRHHMGNINSAAIVLELADRTGSPVISHTHRAQCSTSIIETLL